MANGEDPGWCAGVPLGVKGWETCAGMPTTHGSVVYAARGAVASDSIHVARLRSAGGVPVGKTAAPEFGTLSFPRTLAFGVKARPWAGGRTPGGSSGGFGPAGGGRGGAGGRGAGRGGGTPPPTPLCAAVPRGSPPPPRPPREAPRAPPAPGGRLAPTPGAGAPPPPGARGRGHTT